ncbi:AAA family ATPase [Microbispora sp. RL4-1S]|uniref:AAA family ATPase n=1 Tax=Microbispora oryzae TaxID=2806554 RepID=A0A941AK55_9ACTN|nr:LuxR C-terminal-related transcriptional regulator [Microbispora oryzae]MBP2707125.1 AAA family ATPase [Microbispora oryzae]
MARTACLRQVGNLPADLTSFVGRRRELTEIRRMLSVSRLVTLTGVGGVGKTRLALRAAAEQHRAFDKVVLADLTGLTDPELVVETVAAAAGLRDQSTRPLDALSHFLAAQRTLLVLDNCEHLRDACARLADHLLRIAPELRIIATSRQSLGVTCEHQMPIAPLSVPEPDAPFTATLPQAYDAVGLLVERARAVLPDFALSQDNKTAVVELCRRLDGIPLAIELAAVRLRALSVHALVERLGDRYTCLTNGGLGLTPRQRTLHSLIDWSFRLLSTQERTIWTRMSVFPADFDLDAVEVICTGDGVDSADTLDLVDTLLDKSLLVREEHGGEVRYRMLDTLRQFARGRLSGPDEWAALRQGHRDYYFRLVDRAADEWIGPRQTYWFARLGLERAHLRAAMEHCLGQEGGAAGVTVATGARGVTEATGATGAMAVTAVTAGLRVATALAVLYWQPNSYFNEGRHWIDRLLAASPEPSALRAQAFCYGAEMAHVQSDEAAADLMTKEGLALAERLGDRRAVAHASRVAGLRVLTAGDWTTAISLLERSIAGYEGLRDTPSRIGIVIAMIIRATAATYLGDAQEADRLFARTLDLTEGNGSCRVWALTIGASNLWIRGDLDRATSIALQSLLLSRKHHDPHNVATSLELLAWVHAARGRHREAAHLLGVVEQAGDVFGASPQRLGRQVEFHEQCVAVLKEKLGAEGFARAVRQGRRCSVAQAVARALGDDAQDQGDQGDRRHRRDRGGEHAAHREPEDDSSPLTAREQEIAELIAQGLSNKEISSTLVIAQRTTEGHVEHILAKLGFSSRTQIAAWTTARKAGRRD